MTDHIALIVNPIATRASDGLRQRVEAILGGAGSVTTFITERGGHAGKLASRAIAEGANIVAVIGGDGTVNDVAAAVTSTDVGLVPIPAGSTNVFARAMGWPHPARRALPALEQALFAPHWREVTLGRVETGPNDRVFCVNAGVGLDAETIHRVEAHPWIKTRFRNAGVAVATLQTVHSTRNEQVTVTADGNEPMAVTSLVVVCGSPYAFLGPRALDLAPEANFDGRLRWFGFPSVSWGALAGAFGGAIRGGRHIGRRDFVDGWATRSIIVEARRPVAVQADGEPLGWHTFVRITPGPTLRVLVPSTSMDAQPASDGDAPLVRA